jgi:Zn-dependent peptidase ImmA (M78 family)
MSTAGNMLRLARQLRGFQQSEAAECLRVPNPELSRIETALKEPQEALLVAASELFSVPVEFFKQTDTVYGAPMSVHLPMWRKKSAVSAIELHRIVAELNVRVIHLRRLLQATDLDPSNRIPRFDADEYGNDPEKIAALVRRFWQVPDGPIADLTALVEEAGILVAQSDLGGSSVSGVTFSNVPGVPPLIVLNSTQPADRMRFTLAHELAHIVMHRFPNPDMEDEADQFASCFLVPTDDAKAYFAERRVDLHMLAALKPEWKVSMAALVFAAKRAGALTEGQSAYLWKQFNIHKIKLREPPELDFAPEIPQTLSDLVSLHIKDLGYSLADLAKMLSMNQQEVAKTYALDLPGPGNSRSAHLRVIR